MKTITKIFLWVLSLNMVVAQAQNLVDKKPNVVLITMDGVRLQEFFTGADPKLIANKSYVKDTLRTISKYWKETPEQRREALFPFIWKTIATQGQVYGNRKLGSKMNLTNKYYISAPGYSEILCGFADDKRVNSNAKKNNPNKTVLEHINDTKGYKGRVCAFTTWDVFPYIINEQRSGILVNSALEHVKGSNLSENQKLLNKLQDKVPIDWNGSARYNAFTVYQALEHIKKNKPKLIFIGLDETDEFGHSGDYDKYLDAAKNADNLIEEVWNTLQGMSFYKNNTTLIITTDHGRGVEPLKSWMWHGKNIENVDQVWMALIGPKVKPLGELKQGQVYTNQIAATIAKIMQVPFNGDKIGKPIKTIIE